VTETSAREIAAGLTDAQRQAVLQVPPAWGLPEGHNSWPMVEYDTEPPVLGEVVNECLRLGLLQATPDENPTCDTLHGDGEDIPDVTPQWWIEHTPLGLAVGSFIQENGK